MTVTAQNSYNFGSAPLELIQGATVQGAQTVLVPEDWSAGDLVVLADLSYDSPSTDKPSGFTALGSVANGSAALFVSAKVLVGGDLGSIIEAPGGIGFMAKGLIRFIPNKPISSITPNTWTGELTNGNPAAQTVSVSGKAAPLIIFGVAGTYGSTFTFATETPPFDNDWLIDGDSNAWLRIGWTIQNGALAGQTVDHADKGNYNCLLSGLLAVT